MQSPAQGDGIGVHGIQGRPVRWNLEPDAVGQLEAKMQSARRTAAAHQDRGFLPVMGMPVPPDTDGFRRNCRKCSIRRGDSCKTSKHVIAVDEFHGRTERGVRQEPCAHFNLIAMARLFSSQGDSLLDDMHEGDLPKRRTNFSNALAMLAINLEEMILAQAAALADAVGRMADSILAVRARLRPGRSFPRRSRKPVGKWSRKREQTA